jgi:hypothetical protein
MVAELHGNQYSHCNQTAESIHCKFSTLANVQPGSGNPTIPPLILRSKQIREAINFKAGITDTDMSDFFDDTVDAEADDNLLDGEEAGGDDVVATMEEEPAQPVDVPAIVTTTTATAATTTTTGRHMLMGCKRLLCLAQKCSLVYVSLFLRHLYSLLMDLNLFTLNSC